MATPRLLMRRFQQVLRLKHEAHLSNRAIARACSVGVGTVSNYLVRAKTAGLSWPLPAGMDETTLEAKLFPPAPPSGTPRSAPECAWMHQELRRPGVTLQLLWQEYLENHPDGLRYTQFCARYRHWRSKLRPAMRQVHRAGEKAFVDFSGKRPSIVDRSTGQVDEVELFIGVLGASSYTYAEATASQQLECWIGAHEGMVQYFGGSSEIWVCDNLKSGVVNACRYEPSVNRTYGDLAEHYGAVVIPARPYPAQRQGQGRGGRVVGAAVDPGGAAQPDVLLASSSQRAHPRAAGCSQRPADAEAWRQPTRAVRAARQTSAQAVARHGIRDHLVQEMPSQHRLPRGSRAQLLLGAASARARARGGPLQPPCRGDPVQG